VQTKPSAEAFWDTIYGSTPYSRDLAADVQRALANAHTYFGPLQGRTLLDVGCGAGASSIFWALAGATVTAIDSSEVGIAALKRRCEQLGLTNVRAVVANAMKIDELGPFDFVFGSMILHHLEPFGSFAGALRRSVKDGGKAFFYENNAASALLVWFRTNIVGKLWVPKHGDYDEFPLTRAEVDVLRELFNVRVEYPEMMFFQLAAIYVFRNRLHTPMRAIDTFLYNRNIGVSWSYRQYVMLQAAESRHR
jgi:2-polyprenyl-3-methyl-5-hydroxy-6-metoxy-1,4-benzoquinol methylase